MQSLRVVARALPACHHVIGSRALASARMTHLLRLGLLLAVFVADVHAQSANQQPDPVRLAETVVVTASRTPEDKSRTPRAVSVIDHVTLYEHASRTTPESLMDAAGAFLQKTNHGYDVGSGNRPVRPPYFMIPRKNRINSNTRMATMAASSTSPRSIAV